MSIVSNIGHGIETAGKDIGKAIVWLPEHLDKAIAVLATALKDEPALKTAVLELVQAAGKVIADVGGDVASKGINLSEDIQTVTDVKAFFTYFEDTFLPECEAVVKEIKSDVATPAAAPATAAK
jgi:hypothetical protein